MTTTSLVFPVSGGSVLNQIDAEYQYPLPGDWEVEFANGGRVFLPPTVRVLTSMGCLQEVADLSPFLSYLYYPLRTSLNEDSVGPENRTVRLMQVVGVRAANSQSSASIRPVLPFGPVRPQIPIQDPPLSLDPDAPLFAEETSTPPLQPAYALPDFVARFEHKLNEAMSST